MKKNYYEIYGVEVVADSEISAKEAEEYVKMLEKKHNRRLASLSIDLDGDYVDVNYQFKTIPFERIRRITGYLVGTMERWNDAKTAEEHDRVKHNTGMEVI